jgi:hypothetical protein
MLPIPIYLNIATFLNIFNKIKLSNVSFTLFECFNDNLHYISNFNYTDQFQLFNYNTQLIYYAFHKLNNLLHLDLYYCRYITDSGLLHISKLNNLLHLNLSCCNNITDNGLLHISKLSNLLHLDLSCCNKITDTGLLHISKLNNLLHLDLSHCNNITDTGFTLLKFNLPNITIHK